MTRFSVYFAVLFCFLGSASVQAFDAARFTPHQETVDVLSCDERPQPMSHMRFGFQYGVSDQAFNRDGEAIDYPRHEERREVLLSWDIRYAVHPNIELRVIPTFASIQVEDNLGTWDAQKLGDTWLAAKYGQPDSSFAWGARLAVKIPTGDDTADAGEVATGSGQVDLDVAALGEKSFGALSFSLSAGYRLRAENSDTTRKPGNEIRYHLTTRYSLHTNVSLFLMNHGFWGSNRQVDGLEVEDSGQSVHSLLPGLQFRIDTLSLSAATRLDLSGKNHAKANTWQLDLTYSF